MKTVLRYLRKISSEMELIKRQQPALASFEIKHFYYRGQANREWSVIPSLFREQRVGEQKFLYSEGGMIHQMLKEQGKEVKPYNILTVLEELQH